MYKYSVVPRLGLFSSSLSVPAVSVCKGEACVLPKPRLDGQHGAALGLPHAANALKQIVLAALVGGGKLDVDDVLGGVDVHIGVTVGLRRKRRKRGFSSPQQQKSLYFIHTQKSPKRLKSMCKMLGRRTLSPASDLAGVTTCPMFLSVNHSVPA